MDAYQSNRPPVDDTGLSGGVSFKFGNQIAVQRLDQNVISFNFARQLANAPKIYTLDVCVDGVPKKLDVYVSGQPYEPPSV
jgi:hypothetical protein